MKISASIVTYNSIHDIRGVLSSLQQSDCYDRCTVTVVDNGSTDGTVALVENDYPGVSVIRSGNVGYGAGNNQALKTADSDYHFVLNPDVLFGPTLLSDVIAYMEQNPACVLCTPDAYDAEGNRIPSPKKAPRLRYILARFLPFQFTLLQTWRDEFTDYHNQSTNPYPIQLCPGFFMAMRTGTAQAVGGFDERFFLYYEDTDLSRRMGQLGDIMCLPQLRVVHNEKRAAYHSRRARWQMIRSLIRYFRKWGWKL